MGYLFRSDSEDYGKTWSDAYTTEIPNPNSAVDVAKLDSGLLVLALNPTSGNWTRRTPLAVAFSNAEGKDWTKPIIVQSGMGSYSYPSVIPTNDGFAMTFTWNRKRIAFAEVSVWCVRIRNIGRPKLPPGFPVGLMIRKTTGRGVFACV